MILFPEGACLAEKSAITRFHELISRPSAIRVGETAAVSTKVHLQDQAYPHIITAIMNADAGKVFYQRRKQNEIVHVDVFHSEGYIDPRKIARSLKTSITSTYLKGPKGQSGTFGKHFISYIDLQTALGGGRIDGPLTYGQEKGVRLAHITHVHLAFLNVPALTSRIFSLVESIESVIQESGLQLRKIACVAMDQGAVPVDLGEYAATTDSYLKHIKEEDRSAASIPVSEKRGEALAQRAAKDVGSAKDALDLLEALLQEKHPTEPWGSRGVRLSDSLPFKALESADLVKFDGQNYKLTEEGEWALHHLRRHCLEIESYLRRLLWSLPAARTPVALRKGRTFKPVEGRSRGHALPRSPGGMLGPLAVAESIMAKGLNPGPLAPEHLRFLRSHERQSKSLLLLLDASASMSGQRITSAKEFLRYLAFTSKGKTCIVVFQDTTAKIACNFTKSPTKLESGINRIQTHGLTPLADGLVKAGELCKNQMNRPFVLCITDGIPTVPNVTFSPTEDAISAAKGLARQGIHLGCIGLEPDRDFLKQLTRAAKGTLYIVDEMKASTMAAIARKERKE